MHDSMNTIAAKMAEGDVVKHKIVVPEGSDIYDIAGILGASRMADADVIFWRWSGTGIF